MNQLQVIKSLLAVNRDALVLAHSSKDWDIAKKLSQQRQRLKWFLNKVVLRQNYCSCGSVISVAAKRCFPCYQKHRYRRKLAV